MLLVPPPNELLQHLSQRPVEQLLLLVDVELLPIQIGEVHRPTLAGGVPLPLPLLVLAVVD